MAMIIVNIVLQLLKIEDVIILKNLDHIVVFIKQINKTIYKFFNQEHDLMHFEVFLLLI